MFDEDGPDGAADGVKFKMCFAAAADNEVECLKRGNMQELTFWYMPLAAERRNYSEQSYSRSKAHPPPSSQKIPVYHRIQQYRIICQEKRDC